MNELSSNKRIAKNTIFLYVRMFITMTIGLYTSRLVLQTLGVEDFGIYNVVGGIVVLLGFLNQTLAVGAQRYITYALGKENTLLQRQTFSSILFLYAILVLIVLFLAETIGLFIINKYLTIPEERLWAANIVYQSSIISCVISFFQVPFYSAIIAYEKMGFYAYVSISETIFRLMLVVLINYITFDKLQIYAIFMSLVQLVTFLLYFVYGIFKCNCVLSIKYEKEILKSMSNFCGWNIFGAVSGVLSTQGINMLLNVYFGPACNAARGISVIVNNAVTQLSSGFQQAANPQITKLYAKANFDGLFKLITINSKISFILMSFIVIPFIIEMPFVLKIWLGTYPKESVLFCKIVLLQSLFLSLDRPFITGIYATGEMKIANLTSGLLYLMVFPISFLLLENGAESYAVFIVALLMQPFILLIDIMILKKFTKYEVGVFFSSVFVRCMIVFGLSFIISTISTHNLNIGFLRLFISIIVSFITTTILCLVIGLSTEERNEIKRVIINNILKK